MARPPRAPRDAERDPELDISSLIDVSFLLLIFFLVSSTLLKRETDLGMGVNGDPVRLSDPAIPLEVAIATDGAITIGGQQMAGPAEAGIPGEISEVREQLLEHRKRAELVGEQPLVSLDASAEVGTQRFIDVINALSYAGIRHIALAAN